MELRKGQRDAIVRKVAKVLSERNNEQLKKVTDKAIQSIKLTKEETQQALENAKMSKSYKIVEKAIKDANLCKYPNYELKVGDALELALLDSKDLQDILSTLSKQFNIKLT